MNPRTSTAWPVSIETVLATRARIERYIPPTPLRRYRPLDEHVGAGIEISVKHENHQPTNSFKIRNGLSFMTSLGAEQLERGVVAASTGNHGQGIAYAGSLLGAGVTICVPVGNNPEKNAAARALGAELIERGHDAEVVAKVLRLVDAAEFKRRQSAPGTKISLKAFGRDRRLPITNRWRESPAGVREGAASHT
jgi:threonine dehydratase